LYIPKKRKEDAGGCLELPRAESGELNRVEITLSGFPGQTGEAGTDVDLTPSPCSVQNDTTCTGFSDIAIPGIGVGHLIVIFHNHKVTGTHPPAIIIHGVILLFIAAALLFIPSVFTSTGATLFGEGVQAGIDGFPTAQYTIKPL
jgi:hypothetical protein